MVLALALVMGMQVPQTSVAGTIRDRTTGQPLSGAMVALDDVERRVLTDDVGGYLFEVVTPGPHHLSVHLDGFETRTLHALVPPAGRLEINVSLHPDPIPLEGVAGGAPILRSSSEPDLDESRLIKSMSVAAIRNHPLLHEGDVLASLDGGTVLVQPESPGGVHVMGGTPDQTGYELNGIPVLAPHHAAGVFSAWNMDVLSSVDLSAVSYATSALSGVITARTREPGPRFGTLGALSNTQARATVHGPVAGSRYGYVLGVRSGLPSEALRKTDPNYLTSEMGDVVATVEGPLAGGRLTLLSYHSETELTAASEPGSVGPGSGVPGRHGFEWAGSSSGATWTRPIHDGHVSLSAWHATSRADIAWLDPAEPGSADAARRDLGLTARIAMSRAGGILSAGLTATHRTTSYEYGQPSSGSPLDLSSTRPLLTAVVDHEQPISATLRARAGVSVTHTLARFHASPRLEVIWAPRPGLDVSAGASRRHQFTASLRNHESLVGLLLPADLSVNVDGSRLPVSTSDDLHLSATYQPHAGTVLRARAFTRTLRGVAQIATSSEAPFATDSIGVGGATASGVSLEGTLSRTHVALLAAYGWQRVRMRVGELAYTPHHGVSQRAHAGVTVFPSPTFSIRIGVTGQWGRRATAFAGPLDWEACNVLDQGCEFGGAPRHDREELGGLGLPAYLRADLGLRKHWHVAVGPVQGVVGLYGTITNLLGRPNTLTYGTDPESGRLRPLPMVPFAPLVIGVDWRF